MNNKNNTVNKDISNSLNKYFDYTHKGTNIVIDTANEINKWYASELEKIADNELNLKRLETNVDNILDERNIEEGQYTELKTKVGQYNQLQTIYNKKGDIKQTYKIKTQSDHDILEIKEDSKANNELTFGQSTKLPKKIETAIKGAKVASNSTNKIIRTGKTISEGMNENGLRTFETSSSRIMTKPIRRVTNKLTKKATQKFTKESTRIAKNTGKQIVKKSTNVLTKMTSALAKIVMNVAKLIISMLPSIAPVIIIILIVICFCTFFGLGMSEDIKKSYEQFMISTQNKYDKQTVEFYNNGYIVDGTIDGKGMINWKAPLAIIQMLNADLTLDFAEMKLLTTFDKAGLYEKITEQRYTYEKEIKEIDKDGNEVVKKKKVTETKKIVYNPSLEDYINWCNNNFYQINEYKREKQLVYDISQTSFTDSEIEQIKLLYNSNSFFELFSKDFQSTYAYLNVNIGDEQIQAIYNEFLKNVGKRYLMDHSNLSYDSCMEYYDCSSWVIHCLAHANIAKLPNTNANGIYKNHCYPINVKDRQAGDLIFLKDTYNTGIPGGISHIGIYMGKLTINGETAEYVIDTGSNPSGVRIRKYNNGWWNGSHFYGFGRLKK